MKIAIIGHKRIPSNEGGIEKGVEMHAVRMAALGHKVTVYNRGSNHVFGKKYNEKRRKTYKGVRIITVPTVDGKACVPLYSFLATLHAALSRYDVVSYRASGPCAMIPLAKLFGLRCVASLHGIDSQRDKWGKRARKYLEFGERMAAKKADVCLVLSRNMQKYIRDRYGTEAVLFANGITRPEKREAKQIKEKWGLEKDSYLLSLGRIVPEKGLLEMIQAFKQCRTSKKLVIAGGAEGNSQYYETLQREAKDDDRIVFTGLVKGTIISELYSNAYIFLLPSHLEGMANSLLEAMSFGNCCLVSDIPENTEVVENHGVWFETKNSRQLKERLQELLDNPSLVEDYRRTAADFILNRYNWDTIVEQMLEIYQGHIIDYSEMVREKRKREEVHE